MKTIKLFENIYYISDFTNIGVINTPHDGKNHIYLIDSGLDPENGPLILEELKKLFADFTIEAIINTHGHVDHVGVNHYFQENFNSKIYIPKAEAAITEDLTLSLEKVWGADAIHQLKNWYDLRETFTPSQFIADGGSLLLADNSKLEFISLYGHSPEQLGIMYTSKENHKILFAGDAFLGLDELDKCKISFQEAPLTALESMKKLLTIEADYFVQSHGFVEKDLERAKRTVEGNIYSLQHLIEFLLKIINKKDSTLESLVQKSFKKFNIRLRPVSYALISSTIKSLLSELYEKKEIGINLTNGKFYWVRAKK
ncbi:MAG: MBL fold metallo-hydrolase [Treponema sp.]|nr:MBL fold metallo-hydrolase [Treponema sp.]